MESSEKGIQHLLFRRKEGKHYRLEAQYYKQTKKKKKKNKKTK